MHLAKSLEKTFTLKETQKKKKHLKDDWMNSVYCVQSEPMKGQGLLLVQGTCHVSPKSTVKQKVRPGDVFSIVLSSSSNDKMKSGPHKSAVNLVQLNRSGFLSSVKSNGTLL